MHARSPQELSAAFADAINGRDLPAALELWIDDATMLTADGSALEGRDAIAVGLRALIENDVHVDVEIARLFSAGDVALAVGTLTLRGQDGDGNAFEQQSNSVVVYARGRDGAWRLAMDAPWGLPAP